MAIALTTCQKGSTLEYTVFVDQTYTGSISDGSYINPYSTISQALASIDLKNVEKLKIIHVKIGIYTESLELSGARQTIIEGGSEQFTLKIPANGRINISGSGSVTLRNFIIDGSLATTGESILSYNTASLKLENLKWSGASSFLSSDLTALNINSLSLSSTSTSAAIIIAQTKDITITNTSFTGGFYSIDIKSAPSITISNSSFSSPNSSGIQIKNSAKINLNKLNISMPANTAPVAGIYLSDNTGGTITDVTITGPAKPTTPCSTLSNESGIYVRNQTILEIIRPTISNFGCSGAYVESSTNVTISRFNITANGIGIYYNQTKSDLFEGNITNSQSQGVLLKDSTTSIDFTNIDSTTNGPGVQVTNTKGGAASSYSLGNVSVVSNNSAEGFISTGNSHPLGLRITISNTTFKNNGSYAISGDTPTFSIDYKFNCSVNTFISQALVIHANLAADCLP